MPLSSFEHALLLRLVFPILFQGTITAYHHPHTQQVLRVRGYPHLGRYHQSSSTKVPPSRFCCWCATLQEPASRRLGNYINGLLTVTSLDITPKQKTCQMIAVWERAWGPSKSDTLHGKSLEDDFLKYQSSSTSSLNFNFIRSKTFAPCQVIRSLFMATVV